MLTLVLMLMFGASRAKPQSRQVVVAQRNFSEQCAYKVVQTRPPLPLNEKIEIECDHRHVLTYDLGDFSISGFNNIDVTQDDRIVLTWERGMMAGVTVVKVSDGVEPTAKVIFEKSSRSGVEVMEDGNVLLYHVGRLLRDGEEVILPRATNVYVWKDGEYRFRGGYQWKPDYRRADRYCILYKPEACPAVKSATPIKDDLS